MAAGQFAWVTHAPADYVMVFLADPGGEHAVVSGYFDGHEQAARAGRAFEAYGLGEKELNVYCTLPGEPERILDRLRPLAPRTSIERGTIAFVAVGGGSTTGEPATEPGKVSARIIRSGGGDAPRCYRFERQCKTCGELLGRINVLPRDEVRIDTRELSCRCRSIPCRYCTEGRVRRPLTEHIDPERRAGRMPWYGYLVPCGGCQVAGRGPRVQISA